MGHTAYHAGCAASEEAIAVFGRVGMCLIACTGVEGSGKRGYSFCTGRLHTQPTGAMCEQSHHATA